MRIGDLKGRKVGICASGGLDSKSVTTRLKEAQKLGFSRAILPAAGELDASARKMKLSRLSHLKELAETCGACQ